MVSTLEHIAHPLCWFSCSCLVSLAFFFPPPPFLFLFPCNSIFGPSSAPIAYPIAKVLDYVLGADRQLTYKKAELKSFLQFHRTGEEPLRDEELTILNGVLELNTKEVERIMTPLRVGIHSFIHFCWDLRAKKIWFRLYTDDLFFFHLGRCGSECGWYPWWDCSCFHVSYRCFFKKISQCVKPEFITFLSFRLQSGYSRFPVHESGNPTTFIGLLLIKKVKNYIIFLLFIGWKS